MNGNKDNLSLKIKLIRNISSPREGNPSAGLGYYRVPNTMTTEVNGDKIEYADKMPNTGIVRNDQCQWINEWHAYKCHGINHRLLILESLDIDTLDRRLSPVAMLANPGSDGYIDLINGPQDWSCCFGYACQKRISNFYSIIGTNMMYEVHLTSVPPIQMRFRLNNNEGGDPVLIKLFFQKPQRIDIYVGDQFVAPNNLDLTDTEHFTMLPADDKFIPSLESQVEGENYFDPTTGFLYLLLRGTNTVDYRIQPSVVTKVGATIDMDNFFEGDVAGNIAALLGIDPANIRVTNVVREGKRKKRESYVPFAPTWDNSEDIQLEMTIEPPPVTNLTEGSTSGNGSAMSYGDLKSTLTDLTNSFQNGSLAAGLAAIMNISVNTMATTPPIYVPQPEDFEGLDCIPQDEDPEGECYFGPEDNTQDGVPWSEASQANATAKLEESLAVNEVKVPAAMVIGSQQPFTAFEMSPIDPKIKIYLVDDIGDVVTEVGGEADPWIITASLASGPGGLANNLTCAFKDGWCSFESLAVDTMGDNYTIQFSLTYPSLSQEMTAITSDPFSVGGRQFSVRFTQLATLNAMEQPFSAEVTVWDDALDMPAAADVLPSGVSCTVTLMGVTGASLNGTLEVPLMSNLAQWSDLVVDTSVTGAMLGVDCVNDGQYFQETGFSDYFNVHPYPKIGEVKTRDAELGYSGDKEHVEGVITALIGIMTN